MLAIIAPHANNLRWRNRRQQIGRLRGIGSKSKPSIACTSALRARASLVGKVFLRRLGQIHNPQLAARVSTRHSEYGLRTKNGNISFLFSPSSGEDLQGFGTVSSASADRALSCPSWSTALQHIDKCGPPAHAHRETRAQPPAARAKCAAMRRRLRDDKRYSPQGRFRVRLPAQIDCGLRSGSPPLSPAVATAARPVGTPGGNTSSASTRTGGDNSPANSSVLPSTVTLATRCARYS